MHSYLCRTGAEIGVQVASTLCQLRHIPTADAMAIVEELTSDLYRLEVLAHFLNHKSSKNSVLVGIAVHEDLALATPQWVPPPAFGQPLYMHLYQLQQATVPDGNRLAKVFAKWIRQLRQNLWRVHASFLFLFVRENQPLQLRSLYERRDKSTKELVPRDDTNRWLEAIHPLLDAQLPIGFTAGRTLVSVPPGTCGWFLMAWDQSLSANSQAEAIRVFHRIGVSVGRWSLGELCAKYELTT